MTYRSKYICILITMNKQEKYLEAVLPSLSPYNKKKFQSGYGYTLACPFCRSVQKRESKKNEKCAAIYPVDGSFHLMFQCSRGENGGKQGVVDCSKRMRFDTFLKHWNPPLHRKYVREKELAKQNYQPRFADQG